MASPDTHRSRCTCSHRYYYYYYYYYYYCLIIQRRVTLFLLLGRMSHRGVRWQNNKKTQLIQTNKPKGIIAQTTERKLGSSVNWQVTLKQQGVKPSIISNIIVHHEAFIGLTVSSKVFHVVFVNLVYNSALFLAPCCCSLWLHVVDNLICISLVSRPQLVLLTILPKSLHSFYSQNGGTLSF